MFHKSQKGRVVNFDELVHKNAKTIAVGNANLNARGDLVGRAGQVVESAEHRAAATTVVSSSSKASIQSEIAALKAARSGWTNESIPDAVDNESSETDEETSSKSAVEESKTPEAPKKARKITESE
ncbi:MAG: hypothetical protein M0R77_14895 [Gammaproteobacteria bacterium]|nr:hypothetical protein [Gammaproteobacteria bacterium]